MADGISKDELKDLLKQLLDDAGPSSVSIDPKSAKSLAELVKQYDKYTAGIKELSAKQTMLGRALANNVTVSQQVSSELKKLDEAIENATDSADQEVLMAKRREMQLAASHATQRQMLAQFGQSMSKVGSTAFAGAGQFVKGLQSGSSGIDLASGLMTAGLEMAGETSKALGDAAGSAGQVMMTSTNPKLKALGTAAAVAGPLIGQLGASATKLAKFGVEVLQKEVEKTVKAFHTATASGAVFADGMTGLRNNANAAGLTVDQFAGVLSKHSTDLAAVGLGVTEGAKKIGGALQAGGPEMRLQLQKLGYGFEEQAGLVAETMRDMRSSGGPLRASNAQVAAETSKYAENLRTISAITGEDAKKKMEQVREQANQLAFQQKLAEMEPQQRAAALRAMSNMSEIERKNFMDMVNFGAVINKEGAAAAALSEGLTSSVNASYEAFQAGKLDEIEQRKIQSQYTDQIKQDMLGNTAIGMAGAAGVGGLAQALSETMGKELQYRNAWTEEAIAAAESGVQAQKNATDKLTASVTGAELAAQNLKIALEQELTPAIGRFAEVAKEMLTGVQKMLKDVGLGEGPKKEEGMWGKIKKGFTEDKWLSKGLQVGGAGAMIGGAAASATGVGAIGGIPLATIGAVMTGIGTLADMFGFARGGISTGDEDGYLTKLHGKELIVPINGSTLDTKSDGYAEMVKLISNSAVMSNTGSVGNIGRSSNLMGEIGASISQIGPMGPTNTDILEQLKALMSTNTGLVGGSSNTGSSFASPNTEMVDLMKQFINKQDKMEQHLYDQKNLQQRLVDISG